MASDGSATSGADGSGTDGFGEGCSGAIGSDVGGLDAGGSWGEGADTDGSGKGGSGRDGFSAGGTGGGAGRFGSATASFDVSVAEASPAKGSSASFARIGKAVPISNRIGKAVSNIVVNSPRMVMQYNRKAFANKFSTVSDLCRKPIYAVPGDQKRIEPVPGNQNVRPVRISKASMYLARVFSTTSSGKGGGGELRSQSVWSNQSRTNCLSKEGCPRPGS